jgi:hypothetical protein
MSLGALPSALFLPSRQSASARNSEITPFAAILRA